MSTERSDQILTTWHTSTEKFDYFVLGVVGALCAFIGQGYRPVKLGLNPGTLELVSLLILVLAVVEGFRRIEQTLLVTSINHQRLHAYEVKGGLVSKMLQGGDMLINEATGQIFNQNQAKKRVDEQTRIIQEIKPHLEAAKSAAFRHYRSRNALTLFGFLLLLTARVWSAYR